MVSEEPFPIGSLIPILVQPFCDLFERPTILTKFDNRIVKELLVVGINRGKSESGSSQGCGETEVIFHLWNPSVGNYSTVTDFARLRG